MAGGRFARSVSLTLATNLTSLFIAVASSIVLARALGPAGKGIYSIAILIPSLVTTLGNLGLGAASAFHAARGEHDVREVMGTNLTLSILLSLLGVGLSAAFIAVAGASVFKGVGTRILYLALALIPLEILFSNVQNVILGLRKYRQYNYASLIQSGSYLVFVTVAIVILRTGVRGAIVSSILAWSLNAALVVRRALKLTGGAALRLNRQLAGNMLVYGLQSHIANVLGFLNYRLDMFLVNFYLGPAAVGLYSVGVALAEKVWLVAGSASVVLFPRVASDQDGDTRVSFSLLVTRSVFWLSTLIGLAIVAVARPLIVALYSSSFAPAATALQALMLGIIPLSAGKVVSNYIAGAGHPRYNAAIGALAVATNLALNVLWIPSMGIVGAALASGVSYTLQAFCSLLVFRKLTGARLIDAVALRRADLRVATQSLRSILARS